MSFSFSQPLTCIIVKTIPYFFSEASVTSKTYYVNKPSSIAAVFICPESHISAIHYLIVINEYTHIFVVFLSHMTA